MSVFLDWLRSILLGSAILTAALAAASPAQAQTGGARAPNECATCHGGLSDAAFVAPAVAFRGGDVHQERGFTCADCHGGDPTVANKDQAKAPETGYTGIPRGTDQIAVCARCHSDAAFMRGFAPRQRVDQASEYAVSVHGIRLAEGDLNVATCASCHGAHGIRTASDARSPVFPTNVAATCASCHSSESHMAGYELPDGSPLPTTQRAEHEMSAHYEALTERNDLSAPTCNDCHGNHGAAPPGVRSVANVCGTCHAVFATKFETSVHSFVFEAGCVECHGNHAIVAPPPEMLGTSEDAVCSQCHGGDDDPGFLGARQMRAGRDRLRDEIARTADLIERARVAGMEVGDEVLALGEVRNHLVLARTEMHAFTPETVQPIIDEGLSMLTEIERAGEDALDELRFRRRGLAVSLGAILLFVVALALKIRQIDRRRLGAAD